MQVSALDSNHTDFLPIHDGEVRDVKFNHNGEHVLTASMDKTVALSNFHTKNVLQMYESDLSFCRLPSCVPEHATPQRDTGPSPGLLGWHASLVLLFFTWLPSFLYLLSPPFPIFPWIHFWLRGSW